MYAKKDGIIENGIEPSVNIEATGGTIVEKRLHELLPGEEAVIVRIELKSSMRKRLIEMGFRKGVTVTMLRDAPMGDPMEITIMGYNISLRRSEAMHIVISGADKECSGDKSEGSETGACR